MPRIRANGLTINYDQQGAGEPLVLIPYLAADHACYAFQTAEYAKHFTCISLDLRGTGETDKPEGAYTTEQLADDVAAFMDATGIGKAHVAGLSLGAAIGMWLAAKYPDKVESLSLHGGWPKTDAFQRTIVEGWQVMATTLGVPEMTIRAIFPWCFTPELYAAKPEYIEEVLEPAAAEAGAGADGEPSGEKDPLYDQAVEIVVRTRRPSISLVQRHLRIGYNRAARLIEDMEKAGLVTPMASNGNREIIQPARDK